MLIRRTGLFYVIDGFLDMILPVDEHLNEIEKPKKQDHGHERERSSSRSEFSYSGLPRTSQADRPGQGRGNRDRSKKPLFTVKPGGIAGYLCESSSLVPWSLCVLSFSSIALSNGIIRGHCRKDGHIRRIPALACVGAFA